MQRYYAASNERCRTTTYREAILKRLGRLDEAESDLMLTLKLATQHAEIADALYNLGGVLSLKGETERSFHYPERLAELIPEEILHLPQNDFINIWDEPRFHAHRNRCGNRVGSWCSHLVGGRRMLGATLLPSR